MEIKSEELLNEMSLKAQVLANEIENDVFITMKAYFDGPNQPVAGSYWETKAYIAGAERALEIIKETLLGE